ncbi:hypothetical protein MYAM1_001995 [Malassezia yamatoensis]|uniref:Adenine DNA glycosylase n=1 Tax=Malassezia yamatoensis TaxID=253288 RepID=A0AAJ6CIU5_9BASI|nr:hypothetical protein MYAM1_001995 [Malassezia yamatoensis]
MRTPIPKTPARTKKRKTLACDYLLPQVEENPIIKPAKLPLRRHTKLYHRPQLLTQPESIRKLLEWFETEESKRNMPWRQEWIDPRKSTPSKQSEKSSNTMSLDEQIKRRAYQVWISEIMLQQTRVETVKSYWEAWMERWPTIELLANASPDDVLAAWRGLGYYSRATRIHEAAKKVVGDPEMQGMLPDDVDVLEQSVPGVGRYTAGAICSIVFGHAVPILDGNIARVLSRQVALFADSKTKQTTDLLWEVARLLVERVARTHTITHEDDATFVERSAIPGKWNQALMELGSTLCTPTKPDCASCPIQSSCLAYAEGIANASAEQETDTLNDIEDLCSLCDDTPVYEDDTMPTNSDGSKIKKVPKFANTQSSVKQMTLFGVSANKANGAPDMHPQKQIAHAGTAAPTAIRFVHQFPRKSTKQSVRVEVRLVCIVRVSETRGDGTDAGENNAFSRYLVQQRPDKGLLASLWEFPTNVLPETSCEISKNEMCERACDFVQTLKAPGWKSTQQQTPTTQYQLPRPANAHYLGRVKHVFSHLQWDMHVCSVDVRGDDMIQIDPSCACPEPTRAAKWVDPFEVNQLTMGTGLRRCWCLIAPTAAIPPIHHSPVAA